ncbi:phosphotransferase [Bacillus cereus]|uniref:aminoglycoside phosphotransferase family protein n=2 Tax=Bacillus cereus TaxID=1396 RepID=UPI0024070550|nr:phosphotransferase [Bacillus cereus]MDF9596634.1 phosphotransferase [Bacillus cereus]MDF9609783.1 phosphotransferase [Bacillus cereus]MDF9659998.1 phosphotransferase [Bacillus cereus]
MDNIKLLQNRIHFLRSANRIEQIFKGFSPDKKYIVYFKHDEKYILRTGDTEEYERKNTEYQILNEMQNLGVQSPKPIELGLFEDMGICYNINSYIEGEEAKILLPQYKAREQYKIGLEAGKDLAKMHLYKAPSTIEPWYERVMEKHYRYLEEYRTCGIKIKNDEKIIQFIERNKSYLKNRPNQFQHDDFHISNIIVKDKQYMGVIDFNGFDWGDPIHDFVKIAIFGRFVSIPYSIGQINGYFEENSMEEFWNLYSIYVAMTIFSAVVWSIKEAPEQLEEMLERLNLVLEDHKYFDLIQPSWFNDNL